jgi:hypothetical protein
VKPATLDLICSGRFAFTSETVRSPQLLTILFVIVLTLFGVGAYQP